MADQVAADPAEIGLAPTGSLAADATASPLPVELARNPEQLATRSTILELNAGLVQSNLWLMGPRDIALGHSSGATAESLDMDFNQSFDWFPQFGTREIYGMGISRVDVLSRFVGSAFPYPDWERTHLYYNSRGREPILVQDIMVVKPQLFHGDDPTPVVARSRTRPHWVQRVHGAFSFLASGGGSFLDPKEPSNETETK
jgi:hypothetical protein